MKNLFKAINEVANELGGVEKTGEMTTGPKYNFFSEDDVLNALKPMFAKHGLIMFPSGISDRVVQVYTTAKGKPQNHIVANHHFTLGHVASGELVEIVVQGEGADSGDKAANKAATGALKYAIRQTFLISTGDDPDNTSSTSQERAGETTTTTRRPPPPKNEPATQSAAPKSDPNKMNKALAYKVPKGQPFEGDTLEKVSTDPSMGPILISFLSGKGPNGEGKMFEPVTDEDKKLSKAAQYVYDHNEPFKKLLKKYKDSVKE